MASAMTKREQVQAALRGEPVDRVPGGMWGHDLLREWTPEGLAAWTLEGYRAYDWDFIKVNPRATYYAEAWGSRYEPSGNAYDQPRLIDPAIKTAADLHYIKPLDVHQGPFAEHLEGLRLIGEGLAGEAPLAQTVFCPISVINRLTGSDIEKTRGFMHEAPADLHLALASVTKTLGDYAVACIEEAGADGIFFATVEWATHDTVSEAEYCEFGRPYDLQVLARVQQASFNVLHDCRENNMLDLLLDYPVHALNWADTSPGNPTLEQVQVMTDKAVMGGVNRDTTLSKGTPEQVMAEVRAAVQQTDGRRFLLGPNCSVLPGTPDANYRAIREALGS